ncbi:hypothetical protein Bbelb_131090 [Branchiostoma belcheri]|nr:hypothetical protein Bbelb_131090 [Branchiostoma belcheri]
MRISPFLALYLLSLSLNPGLQSRGASLNGSWTDDNNTKASPFDPPFSNNDGYEPSWELEDITIDQKTAKSFLRDHDADADVPTPENIDGEPSHSRDKRRARAPHYSVPKTWKRTKVKWKKQWYYENFPHLQTLSSTYNYFKYKGWPAVKRSNNKGVGGWFMPRPGRFGYWWGATCALWYKPDNWEIDCAEKRRCEWHATYAIHKRHYKEGVSLEYMAMLYSCVSRPNADVVPPEASAQMEPLETGFGQVGHFKTPDYQCGCQLGWTWDKKKKRCNDRNVCNTNHSKCNKAHTKKCHERIGMDYHCECEDGYEGKFCAEERNPCIEDGGNDMCHPNGKCVPVMRTRMYTCECKDGWSDQPEEGAKQLPDCKKKDDPCEKIACMNGGHCEHSKNGDDIYCVCKADHVGDRCQYRRPHWSAWDKWGPCSVTCGAQGIRKRKRYCEDPTGLTDYDCSGKCEDEEVCRPAVCKYSGRWTSWGESTPCSVICGTGVRVRSRHCKYCKDADCVEETQLEAERGSPCDGISQEKSPCNTQACPVPPPPPAPVPPAKPQPKWSSWGAWSSCSTTCGQGLRRRTRKMGKQEQDKTEDCKVQPCPKVVTTKCTTWSTWGACNEHLKMCYRTRDSVRGEKCDGHTYQRSDCSKGQCLGKMKAEGYKEHLYKQLNELKQEQSGEATKQQMKELEKRVQQMQGDAELQAEFGKFFSEEKGRYFGDEDTFIKGYEKIGVGECARRCLEGYGDYDGVNPVCDQKKKAVATEQKQEKIPAEVGKFFSEEKGRYFGDETTFIEDAGYEKIGVEECARRCLEGYGDYDGVNPVCKSFNYRPADTDEETKTSKCWLHKENKDTSSKKDEWTDWPYRNYYQRKDLVPWLQKPRMVDVTTSLLQCTNRYYKRKECHFPFKYKGKTYNSCTTAGHTRPWCAFTANYQTNKWKNCDASDQKKKAVATQQKPEKIPAEVGKFFSEEKGRYFGDETTFIEDAGYEKIGVEECARRCLEGYGDYDGVNPVCKSFNYRPADTDEETKTSKCWLHKENKDTSSKKDEWTNWPYRNYYQRKDVPAAKSTEAAKSTKAAQKKKDGDQKKKAVATEQKQEKIPAEVGKFFSEEKGRYFGDETTFIEDAGYEKIGVEECARRCLEGYGDYDGVNPVCDQKEKAVATQQKPEKSSAREGPFFGYIPTFIRAYDKISDGECTRRCLEGYKDYDGDQKKKAVATQQKPEKIPAEVGKFFSEEKGRYFGDETTFIEDAGYEKIGVEECARRCLEGYGDYDGVNPVCKSFNYRPADTDEETKTSKCWLHKENKDTSSKRDEWTDWPYRNYYQRKDVPAAKSTEAEEKKKEGVCDPYTWRVQACTRPGYEPLRCPGHVQPCTRLHTPPVNLCTHPDT